MRDHAVADTSRTASREICPFCQLFAAQGDCHFRTFDSTSEGPAPERVAAITRLGGMATAVQADVSKVVEIDRLFATTIERYGRVDIVVANAGIELVGTPIADVSESDFDRLFAVNTKGAFFTLKQAAKHIADNGRIIVSAISNRSNAHQRTLDQRVNPPPRSLGVPP